MFFGEEDGHYDHQAKSGVNVLRLLPHRLGSGSMTLNHVSSTVPPSPEQILAAIARLPGQSNAAVIRVLENARAQSARELVDACEAELATRGSLKLTDEQASQVVEVQRRVKNKGLRDVIEIAFRDVPLFNPEEGWIIRELAANPGVRYVELEKAYVAQFGKNDLSLTTGYLVYSRFGYFRHLIKSMIQSDLLIDRGNDGGVTYRLRPEALDAFQTLKFVTENRSATLSKED